MNLKASEIFSFFREPSTIITFTSVHGIRVSFGAAPHIDAKLAIAFLWSHAQTTPLTSRSSSRREQ
jgi:hypothetical protein